MVAASSLAGFLAAHAVWSISDGEILIPIYGYASNSGERIMERLAHEQLEDAVVAGKDMLESNPTNSLASVLIYDGRITLDIGKVDALIVEFRNYQEDKGAVTVALPYTPRTEGNTFAIHRPKIIEMSGHLKADTQSIFESFFKGVDQHEKGSGIWNESLDESI